jgi:hypothetical protein
MADNTKAAADKRLADDKKKLEQDRADRAKTAEDRRKARGTPTPTQEEADLIKLGHHPQLAPDGSPPDPQVVPTKQMEPASGGRGYETRQSGAAHHAKPAS